MTTTPQTAPSTATPDYADARPAKNLLKLFINYLIRVAAWEVVAILAIAVCLLVIPKFRDIFKDFRTSLPALTELLLISADIITNRLGWIPMLALPFIIPMPVFLFEAVCTPTTAKHLRRAYNFLCYLILLLLIGVTVLALFLPLIKLIKSVSGTP